MRINKAAVVAVVVLLVAAAGVAAGIRLLDRIGDAPPAAPLAVCHLAESDWTLTPEQAGNAALIAAVAKRRALPDQAVIIALATALQESKLINVDYGDRDSLGLFQQRPSQGWGTQAQVQDPRYAAAKFYSVLVTVDGWSSRPVGEVAQAVQRSGYPDAYDKWEDEARALAHVLLDDVPAGLSCMYEPDGSGSVSTLTKYALGDLGVRATAVAGPTKQARVAPPSWNVVAWLVGQAEGLHVVRIGYDGQVWTPADGWRPAGADPAAAPKDRIIVQIQ